MPVTLELAPARGPDVQVIAEMSRRLVEVGLPWTWTPARVARHLRHPESLVLVARATGAASQSIAGFAIMHFGDEIAHLNLLAVDSRWQRRGLGRRLIEWLEQSAMTAGTFTLCLEVRARNPVALLFYRELGFRETSRVPRYYSGREDALRLTKDLRHPAARIGPEPGPAGVQGADGPGRAWEPLPVISAAEWLATHFPKTGSHG
jgi:ribosomal-protein-alanine N-acetyltransferase